MLPTSTSSLHILGACWEAVRIRRRHHRRTQHPSEMGRSISTKRRWRSGGTADRPSASTKTCINSTSRVALLAPLFLLLVSSQSSFIGFASSFTFYSQPHVASFASTRNPCHRNAFPLKMVRESDKFGPADGKPPSSDSLGPEVITPPDDGDDEYGDDDEDWLPDMEKARIVKEWNLARAQDSLAAEKEEDTAAKSDMKQQQQQEQPNKLGDEDGTANVDDFFTPTSLQKSRRQIYTDEEEELINQMGGNSMDNPSPKREPGFLGDSTLKDIAFDFQIPVCYLADVLCTWGVPVPINIDDRLGDMVTGEMAFALAEAVHSLDVGEIYDSYSSFELTGLCYEYSIELKDAFDFCVKEGWNLPFGVKTHLRIEQEDKLLQALSDDLVY